MFPAPTPLPTLPSRQFNSTLVPLVLFFRQELEGGARDSFWQTVATRFNDHNFKPVKLEGEEYSKLSVGPTTYVVDAAKCMEEFKKFRTKLAKAMSQFRQSGMGDCPDEEKVTQSNRVFS